MASDVLDSSPGMIDRETENVLGRLKVELVRRPGEGPERARSHALHRPLPTVPGLTLLEVRANTTPSLSIEARMSLDLASRYARLGFGPIRSSPVRSRRWFFRGRDFARALRAVRGWLR